MPSPTREVAEIIGKTCALTVLECQIKHKPYREMAAEFQAQLAEEIAAVRAFLFALHARLSAEQPAEAAPKPKGLCNCNWDGGHEPNCAVVVAHDRLMSKPAAAPANAEPECMCDKYGSDLCYVPSHRKQATPQPPAQEPTDTEMLDLLEQYSELRITTTTQDGKHVKHIEAPGTALYLHGSSIRAAMRGTR